MTKTTAQLRSEGYDAAFRGDFLEAARLYREAASAYPKHQDGALAKRDIVVLEESAKQWEAMARVSRGYGY